MAFGTGNAGSAPIPNPSMIVGKSNADWVKTFTVGQRAAVKTGLSEVSSDQPGQRVGNQDTSQPSHG